MIEIGIDLHIIKTTNNKIINKNGVTIPAYKKIQSGKVIKLSTRCSNGWKVRPAVKWLKNKGIERMSNIIGIAVDERNRMKISNVKWIEYDYPLVRLNLARRDCKKIITEFGWPIPQRSSCVMCPNQTDSEWLDIKEQFPEDWQRAVMIEQDMRQIKPDIFLHKSCVPLDEVKFVGGGWVIFPWPLGS